MNRTPLLLHVRDDCMEKLAKIAREQDASKINVATKILEAGLREPAPILNREDRVRPPAVGYRPARKGGKAWRD